MNQCKRKAHKACVCVGGGEVQLFSHALSCDGTITFHSLLEHTLPHTNIVITVISALATALKELLWQDLNIFLTITERISQLFIILSRANTKGLGAKHEKNVNDKLLNKH